MKSLIADRIAHLRDSIRQSCKKAGRPEEEVKFLLVTKKVTLERILEAWRAGIADFGENRVQELLAKKKGLPPEIRWHMIGHLQTNKVKQVLGEVTCIHSLDRLELIREVEKQARAKGIRSVDGLIQVNSSGEASKFGFAPEELTRAVSSIAPDSPIRTRGLMTIAPFTEDQEKIRLSFRKVRELRERLAKEFPQKDWGMLSMGMSGDYRIAIEEGATLLRMGTAVFGSRE